MAIMQNLPPDLYIYPIKLYDPNTYVHFYNDNGVREYGRVEGPEEAEKKFESAIAKGVTAVFVSGPIPCNNNQHGVYMVSYTGRLAQYKNAKNVVAKINKAHDSVFGAFKTKPSETSVPMQVIFKADKKSDKEDPTKIVVTINYDGSTMPYSFRCSEWKTKGDKVVVYSSVHKAYENVTVVCSELMKESEIIKLANKRGYDDLKSVHSINPITQEELDKLNGVEKSVVHLSIENPDTIKDDEEDGYIGFEIVQEEYDDLPE